MVKIYSPCEEGLDFYYEGVYYWDTLKLFNKPLVKRPP